jgi:metal-sulfur cluster biosynthetic enzyme
MNTPSDAAVVWNALRSIPDPEFGVNIVDLGLIYSVECHDGDIAVTMTLTTESCPSGGWIYAGAKRALAGLPGAKNIEVAMVFDPPWTPAMLSEEANRQLGRIA